MRALLVVAAAASAWGQQNHQYDFVVYGSTPGGVTTAVAASRTYLAETGKNLSVALLANG